MGDPHLTVLTEAPRPALDAKKQEKIRAFINKEAQALGFADMRICRADQLADQAPNLARYIDAGYHGTMAWMPETAARRSHPHNLWSDVRSILLLGFNYGPKSDPRALLDSPTKANISVYARNRDYHDLIKGRLKQLSAKLLSRTRDILPGGEIKVFVDTAPVMEKPLAAHAGLGWQGKHTNLVSKDFGSWLFLGAIFTNLDLAPDMPARDKCGSCRACLDACPTDAFPAPYQIDARRCISYLTIEHKGAFEPELRKAMGNRIYGCDDCLSACPWNKFAQTASEAKLIARDDLQAPDLVDFLDMDDATFRKHFSGSPIKRIGRNRFLRNVLIACGNAADKAFATPIKKMLTEDDPDLRLHAIWALAQILDPADFNILHASHAPTETDEAVQQEWITNSKEQSPS